MKNWFLKCGALLYSHKNLRCLFSYHNHKIKCWKGLKSASEFLLSELIRFYIWGFDDRCCKHLLSEYTQWCHLGMSLCWQAVACTVSIFDAGLAKALPSAARMPIEHARRATKGIRAWHSIFNYRTSELPFSDTRLSWKIHSMVPEFFLSYSVSIQWYRTHQHFYIASYYKWLL